MENTMDWTLILSAVGIALTIIACFATQIGMFLWVRSEASADRRDGHALISSLANDIHVEMKDFHGRLVALEEKHLELIRKYYEGAK